MRSMLCGFAALIVLGAAPSMVQAQGAPGAYRQVAAIPLGSPERWDYVVADAPSGRVYVAMATGCLSWTAAR